MIAGALRIKTEERQELLEELDVAKRLRRLSELLARELELISIGTQDPVAGGVRDGEGPARVLPAPAAQGDPGGAGRGGRAEAEANELREQIEAAELPEHALKQAERELQRFERLPPAGRRARRDPQPTWSGSATLPWSKATDDHLDLKKARRVLDRDHYDIEKVKDRILEFLAVRKLKPDATQLDPLLRRARPAWARPRSGKSIAARDGPQVRAHLRRRRARRVRDPRPPPHLHRRHARHDHPGDARRRHPTTRC